MLDGTTRKRGRPRGGRAFDSDERWAELQAWADRKHPGRQAPMPVQMRVQHLRATVR